MTLGSTMRALRPRRPLRCTTRPRERRRHGGRPLPRGSFPSFPCGGCSGVLRRYPDRPRARVPPRPGVRPAASAPPPRSYPGLVVPLRGRSRRITSPLSRPHSVSAVPAVTYEAIVPPVWPYRPGKQPAMLNLCSSGLASQTSSGPGLSRSSGDRGSRIGKDAPERGREDASEG